jgi:hypothetical protein
MNRVNRGARMQIKSRNQREGTYAGFADRHVRGYIKRFQRPSSALARAIDRQPIWAKPMNLDPWNVLDAVKRVMATHGDLIKALGNR